MVLPKPSKTSSPARLPTSMALGDSTNVENDTKNKIVSVISKNLSMDACPNSNPTDDMETNDDVAPVADSDIGPLDLQELEKAEAEVTKENTKEEKASKKPIRPPVDKRETFKMLQVLLEKSGIYAELILKRMHDEEEKQRKKAEREAKKKAKAEQEAQSPKLTMVTRRRSHSSNPGSPGVKFADFFDKKELQAKRTKYAVEEVPDLKTVNPAAAATISTVVSEQGKSSIPHPPLFTGGTLRQYQLEGLQWLKAQYAYGINGILGDEMGLGKTVQCIALICYLYSEGVSGPFLITAPLSTIPNWISEFERFAPQVPVVLYHGSYEKRVQLRREIKKNREAPWSGKTILPVIITSYEMVINDYRFLSKFTWKHLIIDEAQRVKNFRCRLLQKLKVFTIESRLLLTGTPVQNNLAELWSLLNFLVPDVFEDLEWFESLFGFETVHTGWDSDAVSGLAQKEQEDQMLTKLHRILAPFLLRRLKSDVELELPKKKEVLVYAPMTPLQVEYYKAGVEKTIVSLFREDKSTDWKPLPEGVRLRSDQDDIQVVEKSRGSVMQNLRCVRASVMMFRKITMHPYLLENPLVPGTEDEFLIDENLVLKSGKMLVLDRLLVALKERGHKVLLFSTMTQMLDIFMDYCQLRNFNFCRLDGSMALEDRQIEIKRFNEDPDYFIFMISTRAGGLGLNLMAADTVVIFDSDWNPQVDLQAQDRCHRIGQTKPVIVYRLVTRGTIDERIIERATAKRRLEKMVIHSGKFKQLTQQEVADLAAPMTTAELQQLLQSTDYSECWEPEAMGKEVISDQDLKRLLDRSSLVAPGATASVAMDEGKIAKEHGDAFCVLPE